MPSPALFLVVALALAVLAALWLLRRLLCVAGPAELLVLTGRIERRASGELVGYRLVRGGRALRLPWIERVDSLDLHPIEIEIEERNLLSHDFVPLGVTLRALVRVSPEPPFADAAAECLLGKIREEIAILAERVLAGELRHVVAALRPEELVADTAQVMQVLAGRAGEALARLGLVADTITLKSITDDAGYLEAVARARGSEANPS